jgi:gentisate 1,2-dioxygenase
MSRPAPAALAVPFLDISGEPARKPAPWKPLLVPKQLIDAEIRRLASVPRPANGRRASTVVHPLSTAGHPGLTPATKVTISVLLPGEETLPRRESANLIELCVSGGGTVFAGENSYRVARHDVWNLAPMRPYFHRNTGSETWVRLGFSNETLLDKLGTWFAEEGEHIREEEGEEQGLSVEQKSTYVRDAAPDLPIGSEGARLRGYEFLTDVEYVEARSLLWPWADIEPHMPKTPGDGKRSIWLMYNPVTERRNGTSNSFFATWAGCAPGTPPFPPTPGHRHISASINYHTGGSGMSVVDGATVEWKAGDLLFSAPSWSEHTHYPGPDGWTILTIQDHPMHIALGSLLWQERMGGPIFSLGTERGQTGYTAPREPGR